MMTASWTGFLIPGLVTEGFLISYLPHLPDWYVISAAFWEYFMVVQLRACPFNASNDFISNYFMLLMPFHLKYSVVSVFLYCIPYNNVKKASIQA